MTLEGVMAVMLRYFTEFGSFGRQLRHLRQKCKPKNLAFGNI